MARALALTAQEVLAYLDEVYPQSTGLFEVLELEPMRTRIRVKVEEDDLRFGGTVSGPKMFTAADVSFYIMCMAMVGREALCVTVNCSFDFMRRPKPVDLITEVKLHKLGKTLAVGDVLIFSEGYDDPVCRANMTFSIPPSAHKC